MSYVSEVMADSPLGFWRLGETSGTVAADTSGGGHDGTIATGTVLGAASIIPSMTSGAYDLDASGEGASVAAGAWYAPASAFSASIWYKPDTLGSPVIFARSNVNATNSKANKAWSIQGSSDGRVLGRLYSESGATVVPQSAAGVLVLGQSHHIVLTYDGATVRYYVNGTEVVSAALAGGPVSYASNTQPLSVGAANQSGSFTLDGRIQAAALFGTALSATRVSAHYAAGISTATGGGTASLTIDSTLPAFTSTLTIESYTSTATGNRRNGRIRNGGFVDESEAAVAAVPAGVAFGKKVEKALIYPTPTLVDGRPT